LDEAFEVMRRVVGDDRGYWRVGEKMHGEQMRKGDRFGRFGLAAWWVIALVIVIERDVGF
jgi:hypothetical protein